MSESLTFWLGIAIMIFLVGEILITWMRDLIEMHEGDDDP